MKSLDFIKRCNFARSIRKPSKQGPQAMKKEAIDVDNQFSERIKEWPRLRSCEKMAFSIWNLAAFGVIKPLAMGVF